MEVFYGRIESSLRTQLIESQSVSFQQFEREHLQAYAVEPCRESTYGCRWIVAFFSNAIGARERVHVVCAGLQENQVGLLSEGGVDVVVDILNCPARPCALGCQHCLATTRLARTK